MGTPAIDAKCSEHNQREKLAQCLLPLRLSAAKRMTVVCFASVFTEAEEWTFQHERAELLQL